MLNRFNERQRINPLPWKFRYRVPEFGWIKWHSPRNFRNQCHLPLHSRGFSEYLFVKFFIYFFINSLFSSMDFVQGKDIPLFSSSSFRLFISPSSPKKRLESPCKIAPHKAIKPVRSFQSFFYACAIRNFIFTCYY